MRRTLAASLAVALVTALLVVAGGAPVQARSTRVDPQDARAPIDTRRVSVYPSFRGYVVVRGRPRIRAIEISVPRSCLRITKRPGIRTATWDHTRYDASETRPAATATSPHTQRPAALTGAARRSRFHNLPDTAPREA